MIGCERNGTLPALADLVIEESWRQLLTEEFEKPYFAGLQRFVQASVCKAMLLGRWGMTSQARAGWG